MTKPFLILFSIIIVSQACSTTEETPPLPEAAHVRPFHQLWYSPSADESGSMPLGNGDIGSNVWMTSDGVLHFYLAKTDAFSGNAQLLKLGKVDVTFTPDIFADTVGFVQELVLEDGTIRITKANAQGQKTAELRIWVDAHHPVLQVDMESETEVSMTARLDIWRKEKRELTGQERHAVYGLQSYPEPVYVMPDTVLDMSGNRLAWAHRNEQSIWELTLMRQAMSEWLDKGEDPLMHHIFGGLVVGDGLIKIDDQTLQSKEPATEQHLAVHIQSGQTNRLADWVQDLKNQASTLQELSTKKRYHAHRHWWRDFWNRGYVIPGGTAAADSVATGYILQRFISGCSTRGELPPKFNGSLFTVATREPANDTVYNADYRRWGGPYWFQNTRLIYWPMLEAGDFGMMQPFFKLYMDALPFAKARVRKYFGHQGAMFPETMHFWGSYAQDNYGWEKQRAANGITDQIGMTQNQYIRYHYEGALELVTMMIDYYQFTQSQAFLQDTLLPFSNEIHLFYQEHYPHDNDGQLLVYPAQAIETYWDVENPTPVIAGLHWTLGELLRLPESAVGTENRAFWQDFLDILPPVPTVEQDGQTVIPPAEKLVSDLRSNSENPELYAIYPFRVYGLEKKGLQTARNSYQNRIVKGYEGWRQDETQAAYLGLTEEAQNGLRQRAGQWHQGSRFRGFWGPNFDWVPDQDHGGNLLKALQTMVLQHQGDSILLLPAWPEDWDVVFKMHAPKQTVVEGRVQEGKLLDLNISPASRKDDLMNLLDKSDL